MKESVSLLLPGTACAKYGSNIVNVSHDVTHQLSIGDFVKIGGHLSRVEEVLQDESDDEITSYQILIDPAYKRVTKCGLSMKTNSRYVPLAGTVSFRTGSKRFETSRDLRQAIYRGEAIKVNRRNHFVSVSGSEFTATSTVGT